VTEQDRDRIGKDFADAVNMSGAEIEAWLETPESGRVGFRRQGESESVGHASGRRIVEILRSAQPELTDADYRHMRKTAGYVRRHLAQRPDNMVTSRWRYSLMNWGHDPLK
jgi:Protein of unknown function (DUF3140)